MKTVSLGNSSLVSSRLAYGCRRIPFTAAHVQVPLGPLEHMVVWLKIR
jgi:hypothetical protein